MSGGWVRVGWIVVGCLLEVLMMAARKKNPEIPRLTLKH